MGLFQRGNRIWISFRDVDGTWKSRSSGYAVGEEELAQQVLDEVERRVAAVQPSAEAEAPATVRAFAEQWLDARERRKVRSIKDERARFRMYIVPAIGHLELREVKPRHVRELILSLRALTDDEGRPRLAPRTIRGVYGTLRTMFREAEIEELVASNPVKVPAGTLPKKANKDPAWRATAVFSRDEVEALISDHRLPQERRVLYALLALTGCRFGEVAALRWQAYDRGQEPLGMLSVHVSYDVRSGEEKEVKTGVARRVPVHPTLAAILAEWRLATGAQPGELITTDPKGGHRVVYRELKRFKADLERLGLRRRRIHDLRRTFISLAQVDGARRDLLEVITHGPRGDIMTAYTTYPWPALCAEVEKLRIERIEAQLIELPIAQVAGSPETALTDSAQSQCSLVSDGNQRGKWHTLQDSNL